MTREPLPFDHQPDPVLGATLWRALEPADPAAFVARVLARADEARTGSWHAVLARWARAGVTAAALVALAVGHLVGRAAATNPAGRPSVTEALIAPIAQAPEVEVVLASVIGN